MIDDDLASVLSNVAADARPATRTKIANSAETRAFLEDGTMELRDFRGVQYIITAPGELGLVRAYITGSLEIHGDLHGTLHALEQPDLRRVVIDSIDTYSRSRCSGASFSSRCFPRPGMRCLRTAAR